MWKRMLLAVLALSACGDAESTSTDPGDPDTDAARYSCIQRYSEDRPAFLASVTAETQPKPPCDTRYFSGFEYTPQFDYEGSPRYATVLTGVVADSSRGERQLLWYAAYGALHATPNGGCLFEEIDAEGRDARVTWSTTTDEVEMTLIEDFGCGFMHYRDAR